MLCASILELGSHLTSSRVRCGRRKFYDCMIFLISLIRFVILFDKKQRKQRNQRKKRKQKKFYKQRKQQQQQQQNKNDKGKGGGR